MGAIKDIMLVWMEVEEISPKALEEMEDANEQFMEWLSTRSFDVNEEFEIKKTKTTDFILWLQGRGYKLMKANPAHRPGEGYGPPRYLGREFHDAYTQFLNESDK